MELLFLLDDGMQYLESSVAAAGARLCIAEALLTQQDLLRRFG